MSAYRFCRTDDIPLLVEALRRCWWPHFRDESEPTTTVFKREIRDLQVWCSSCMVAFDGADSPIAVLIGAKRSQETLLHRLAVHPAHLGRGHGRHLVTSLVSKLAILGPPRIVAEVPEGLSGMRALLDTCGFVEETVLTDYVLDGTLAAFADGRSNPAGATHGGAELFSIPVTIEDLAANGLLANGPPTTWERGPETLRAQRAELRGLALVSDDHIAAYALWRPAVCNERGAGTEVVALRATDAADDEVLATLLLQLRSCWTAPVCMRRVHPAELPSPWLAGHGFRAHSRVGLYARMALEESHSRR
jgi:GNAT superfamily N-acetyltransferase